MIKVLIVDDSQVIRDFLYHLLTSDTEIQVVAVANSGTEAIELTRLNRPDVITMDIHMEGMDGYETTRKIMETVPTPIVIVSGSLTIKDEANIFRSLEAGALAVVHRPPGFENPEFVDSRRELIQTVKQMSKVKIQNLFQTERSEQINPPLSVIPFGNYLKRIQLIAIGSSTGGPVALQKILSRLPHDLPVPVLIVQHIAAGFTKPLLQWLSATSGIELRVAREGEEILSGIAYLAPDHYHLAISKGWRINLSTKPHEKGVRPSINWLFRSVAQVIGPNGMGVLLSGVGTDGAIALKAMKDIGALTMVQSEESSVAFDMPGEALRIGAADLSLSPENIADVLAKAGIKK